MVSYKFPASAAALAPTLLLFGNVSAASFYCPGVNETGFAPNCCTNIVGQVGVWCTGALIVGELPHFECNVGPPLNVAGCCQSLDYTNPHTNYTLHLCTDTTPSAQEE